MCGSGTIPIEAALIARNIAPGVYRKGFAFEKWRDFDSELFSKIYDDDSQEKEFHHKIYGYDADGRMVGCARRNIKSAMMGDYIEVDCREIKDFEPMENRAIMVVNPPYGERLLSDKLLETYKTLGSRLKHAFSGNEAWIISSNYECFDQIGLKASARIALFNGDLDCEFRKFELFQGKYSGFRDEGKSLQKDFAPLKRRSRLTGLDGETKESRRQRESYENMTEEEIAAAKRRRQLESYLGGRAGRKPARPRREERDGQGADKKPARDERPARKEFTPGRDNRRPAAKGGYAGKPSQRRSGGDKGGYRRNNKK
jgi:putative N6-adenine-specific DNA methylase